MSSVHKVQHKRILKKIYRYISYHDRRIKMNLIYLKAIFSYTMGFTIVLFFVMMNHRFDVTMQHGMERNSKILYRPKLPGERIATSSLGTILSDDIAKVPTCQKNNISDLMEKTIIIVPYRNRAHNLKLFVSPLHKHLMNQVCI